MTESRGLHAEQEAGLEAGQWQANDRQEPELKGSASACQLCKTEQGGEQQGLSHLICGFPGKQGSSSGVCVCVCVCVCESLSCIWLFATPWDSSVMEFSRQDYWSGLPFPSPGDLRNSRIEPKPPALQADSFTVWATREALQDTRGSQMF